MRYDMLHIYLFIYLFSHLPVNESGSKYIESGIYGVYDRKWVNRSGPE